MFLLDGKETVDEHLINKVLKELLEVLSKNNVSYRVGMYCLSTAKQHLEKQRDDIIISIL